MGLGRVAPHRAGEAGRGVVHRVDHSDEALRVDYWKLEHALPPLLDAHLVRVRVGAGFGFRD